jgi:uridine phosphorylase
MTEKITFRTKDGKSYHLEINRLNPYILTAGSPGRIEKIANYLKNSEIIEGKRKLTVVNGEYKGLPVSGVTTGMGPASTAIVLPEIFESVQDPITLLRLGTSGSLQSWVKFGDLVISEGVIRDECTTTSLVGKEYPAVASPELIPILIKAASNHRYELGKNLWKGITHVKSDLYFCESPHFSPARPLMEAKLNSYREMGALASAMEFSVYCIHRDYFEGKRKRILVGNLLSIIASAPEVGQIDVSKVNLEKVESSTIKIGLDALLLTHKIQHGEKVEIEDVIQKMVLQPSRAELR